MVRPELSVVVASHERPLRLRWLLNALEVQTLDRSVWEVVVCHDSTGPETDRLLDEHPLALAGMLRHTRLPAHSAPPGANRNAATRLARAPTIVFTHDDCRPPPEWLANVHAAVRRNPGAIIQGPVEADPDEHAMQRSPYPGGQWFADVPRPWAECSNIVYPRALIDRVGGFVEDVRVAEDTDFNIRARAIGGRYVGDKSMTTFHAVEEGNVLDRVRDARRYEDLALLVKRHPEFRSELPLSVFWKRTHVWLPIALLGVLLARRNRLWAIFSIPWAVQWQNRYPGVRGQIRFMLELPGRAVIDLCETAALAHGSVRHRSLLL